MFQNKDEIAKTISEGSFSLRNENWKNWNFQTEVKLSLISTQAIEGSEEVERDRDAIYKKVTLKLSFIHLIILLQKNEILKSLVKEESNYDFILETVSVEPKSLKDDFENGTYCIEEDAWIYGANCIHLAALFNHEGMEVILSNIKDSKKLIEDTHIDGHITPLHIATAKFCALST